MSNQKPLKIELEGSKREFELFETRIKNESQLSRISYISCGQTVRQLGPNRFQPIRGNVDFVLGIDGAIAILDAKVTHERVWNLKKYVTHPSKIHQWAQLIAAHGNGNLSGYMIWFCEYQKIVWAPTSAIHKIMENGGLSVYPESPGFTSQPDSVPIDFRGLICTVTKKQ